MITQQPKSLYLLCFTELWERFGFYTLQTIIVLYMSHGLLFSDSHAYLLYGAFSSLLYLTPVLGGFVADRYLGFQKAIIVGGFLFIISYLLCALPGKQSFFLGLSLLILANGFLKPNISSIVGDLYQKDDPRRDGGFTLFYMGINIGALLPPLFAGDLVHHYGWHSGFLFAAIGMTIGLVIFLLGRKNLPSESQRPSHKTKLVLIIGAIALVAVVNGLFLIPKITSTVLIIASVLIVLWVIILALQESALARNKIIAALILTIISVGFWALYNQTFSSLMLFAERNMTPHFLGMQISAEFTQFFNPFFIIVLSPILSLLWLKLGKTGLNPSTPKKFFLSTLFILLGFWSLALTTRYLGNANGMISPWYLALSYFLQTIGELLISPIGLAMITVLVPKRLVGMMMGVWFLSQAAAFALSGLLATISSVPDTLSKTQSLLVYSHAFVNFSWLGLALCIATLVLMIPVGRLIKN